MPMGAAVRLRELLASQDPVMMNFIFTTCGAICPVMSKVFSEVPGSLGAQAGKLRMVSISIDPENDTPAQLKSYAKTYGATRALDVSHRSRRGRQGRTARLRQLSRGQDESRAAHPAAPGAGPAVGSHRRLCQFAKDLAQEYRKMVKQ